MQMLNEWLERARSAERKAHGILAMHEAAHSRVVLLENLSHQLNGTPKDVQDYFQEAIECLQSRLYRAGVITAWSGHIYMFSKSLYQKHEDDIHTKHPKLEFTNLDELIEKNPESRILDFGKDVGFINRSIWRVLQGQLSERNQCAHPTKYRPSMNEAIGYVDKLINQTLSYRLP